MPGAKTDQKRKNAALILIGLVLAALVTAAFVTSQQQTAADESSRQQALQDQEYAYENILKDSLQVYYSRYQNYPTTYQQLLDDIRATPSIYGVNEEGMTDLTAINQRLADFSYASLGSQDYVIRYKNAVTGATITVTN